MYAITDNTVCTVNRNKFHLGMYSVVTLFMPRRYLCFI